MTISARAGEGLTCACDWPGCQGQCHTGDKCPCHPLDAARAGEGLRAELLRLLGPSHPHDEGRECGACAAYNLLAAQPAAGEGLDAVRAAVEAMTAYHPHEAPYVGGNADLPCFTSQCAGGMRLAVLRVIDAALHPDTAETAYPGQHDDCIATVPHFHARPYQTGEYDKGNDDQRRKDDSADIQQAGAGGPDFTPETWPEPTAETGG